MQAPVQSALPASASASPFGGAVSRAGTTGSEAMPSWRYPTALTMMVASGFAGLGYQVVWTQQCALWLGHESAAVLAVIAAFFGGIALGALLLGARIEHSPQPARWYACCEAVIALWSLLLLALMQPFSDALLAMMGPQPSPWVQWTLAFGGTLLLFLPATVAMGATLPAIERVIARQRSQRAMGAFYACNTFGAVLGVLATAFWTIPSWGLSHTAMACAALNALCAVAAWFALPHGLPSPQRKDGAWLVAPTPASSARVLLWQLALTGMLGIGYEVLVVRVLSQVAEDTVYTFAMLLAVYLVGTAAGAAAYQRWLARVGDTALLTQRLLAGLSAACLLGTWSLWRSEPLHAMLRDSWGATMAAAVGAEAGLAVAAFALPTFIMGALFSHLCACASLQGVPFGRSLGVNTLGAAIAPLFWGVLLAPLLGPKWALVLLVAGYAMLVCATSRRTASSWSPAGASALVLGLLAIVVGTVAPPLSFVDIPEGGHLVSYKDGVMAAVSVVEDAGGVATLRINNRQQEGSSATLLVDGRQAVLPMLLHPHPQRALFLGLGTGVTSGTAAEDPTLAVDAVELLPEVIEASRYFSGVFDRDEPNDRLHVVAADARRYVRAAKHDYDLIVADNFQPARSGSGALYTVEHFRNVKARLAPDGLFCQWLPLHQLDIATLRSIVRSFMSVNPKGVAILANNSLDTPVLGLVGTAGDRRFSLDALRARLAHHALPQSTQAFGIDDEWALLGSVLAGPSSLTRFAMSARANTDDLPVVAYMAPHSTYAPPSPPAERLVTLLNTLSALPEEVLEGHVDPVVAKRLQAYWAARRSFIESGLHVQPSADVRAMLAQVRVPLLEVLRISADFRPAYEPLVGMAMALAPQHPDEARALLSELVALQPAWPQARQALQRLP